MARDYAKQSKAKRTKTSKGKQQNDPLAKLWYITAFAVIAFVGGLIYLKHEQLTAKPAVKPHKYVKHHAKPKAKPQQTVSKPRFEFYDMLANSDNGPERIYNQEKIKAQEHAKYFLQVAAFKKMSQADHLRAELTLKGFTVAVKNIKTKGKQWSRVQVGPYSTLVAAKHAQKQLSHNSYKSVIRTN